MKHIEKIFEENHKKGYSALTEAQCYEVFARLGLNMPEWRLFDYRAENFENIIGSFPGEKIVLKISSPQILHKTEAGGVKIVFKADALKAFNELKNSFPGADGVLAVEFADYTPFTLGAELMLGTRADAAFGPVMALGFGGTGAEFLTKNLKEGISPSLAMTESLDPEEFVIKNFAARYAQGLVRGGKKHAEIKPLVRWVSAFCALANYFSDGAGRAWTVEEAEINPLAAAQGVWTALDGVIRFRPSKNTARSLPSAAGIKSVVRPRTAAVIGVSEKSVNMGRIILNNIIKAGMPAENVCVIKPGAGVIDGVKCYASAKDAPFKIDTLVVTVPASSAPRVIQEAADSGNVTGVVLISGGAGEKEGSGDIKNDIESIVINARKKNPDFTLNGGNSLGIVSNPSKLNTLFIPEEKLAPPLGSPGKMLPCAFLSQSGAFVISVISKNPWLKPVYSVTAGNQLDAGVTDYAAFAVEDEAVKVLLLYIEGFKDGDGARLIHIVRRAAELGKRVVIYKAGRTAAGQKAVMGHTASIAGDYLVTKTLLARAGALVAESFEEFELLSACAATLNKKSGNFFMISNGGFETSGMADGIAPGGVISADFPSDKLKNEIGGILKKYKLDGIVDVRNPFDVTPMAPDDAYFEISRAALKSGQYGGLLFGMVPLSPAVKTLKKEKPDIFKKLAALSKETGLPVAVVVSGGALFDYYAGLALAQGLPVFRDADKAVRLLNKFLS